MFKRKRNRNMVDEQEYCAKTVQEDRTKLERFAVSIAKHIAQILLFLIVMVTFWSTVINAQIPSQSMEPTIDVGDRIFGWKCAYRGDKSPERYDIVIFKRAGTDTYLIKRVIGLPGDELEFRDEGLYINGVRSKDSFTKGMTYQGDLPDGRLTVPDGCYFVMGDNREDSLDSRFWMNDKGENVPFITDIEIVAKAAVRYFPFTNIGPVN